MQLNDCGVSVPYTTLSIVPRCTVKCGVERTAHMCTRVLTLRSCSVWRRHRPAVCFNDYRLRCARRRKASSVGVADLQRFANGSCLKYSSSDDLGSTTAELCTYHCPNCQVGEQAPQSNPSGRSWRTIVFDTLHIWFLFFSVFLMGYTR